MTVETLPETPDGAGLSARRGVSPWWRVLSIALLLALLLAWAASATLFEQFKDHIQQLQHKVASVLQVHYLAVMLDAKQQPAMLLTIDRGAKVLRLQRLNEVKEGREDSMQLWALSGDRAPRSLGDGRIVVAHDGRGATLHMLAHAIHHPGGIATVADEIADEGMVLRTLRGGVLEHRLNRLTVGVEIGDHGDLHGSGILHRT